MLGPQFSALPPSPETAPLCDSGKGRDSVGGWPVRIYPDNLDALKGDNNLRLGYFWTLAPNPPFSAVGAGKCPWSSDHVPKCPATIFSDSELGRDGGDLAQFPAIGLVEVAGNEHLIPLAACLVRRHLKEGSRTTSGLFPVI